MKPNHKNNHAVHYVLIFPSSMNQGTLQRKKTLKNNVGCFLLQAQPQIYYNAPPPQTKKKNLRNQKNTSEPTTCTTCWDSALPSAARLSTWRLLYKARARLRTWTLLRGRAKDCGISWRRPRQKSASLKKRRFGTDVGGDFGLLVFCSLGCLILY